MVDKGVVVISIGDGSGDWVTLGGLAGRLAVEMIVLEAVVSDDVVVLLPCRSNNHDQQARNKKKEKREL